MRLAFVALFILVAVAAPARAETVATLDFDSNFLRFAGVTSTATPSQFAPGDMFNTGNRSSLQPNGIGLPFAISDDSIAAAEGNTVFETDTQGVVGQAKTDTFFGVSDTVNGNAANGPDTQVATWSWDVSDVAAITSLSIDFAAMGDFELADQFLFEVLIDGIVVDTAFSFTADESLSLAYFMDNPDNNPVNLDDPLVETITGTVLNKADRMTGAFTTLTRTFVSVLSGSTLGLRLTATADGGTEAFAFDNVSFEGRTGTAVIPEPSSILLAGFGLAALAGVAIRRRRLG
jgi:hypothetical protein